MAPSRKAADPEQDPMLILGRRLETLDRLEKHVTEGFAGVNLRLQDGEQRFCHLEESVAGLDGKVSQMSSTLSTITQAVLTQAEARGQMTVAFTAVQFIKHHWPSILIVLVSFGSAVAALLPLTTLPQWAGLGGLVAGLAALVRIAIHQGGPPSGS